ncbi:MAG: helix-turn-helix transcriptional regulator [Acidimicrobiales bacterium]
MATGLAQALRRRAEVAGDTPYGAVAVQLAEFLLPEVVVAGELLADGLADHYLPALVRAGCRVLLVVDELQVERMVTLVGRGLAGICTTDQSLEEVSTAVLEVAGGGVVLPPAIAASIVAQWRSSRHHRGSLEPERVLSLRELEVLNAMADGLSVKATARLLGVATKTVENHRTRVFAKLGVRNQAQLVGERLGGQLSLVPPVGPSDGEAV